MSEDLAAVNILRTANLSADRVGEYVKWTSAITTAAALWVAQAIPSLSGVPLIAAMLSLLFFIASLGTAVYTARRIVAASVQQSAIAIVAYASALARGVDNDRIHKEIQESVQEAVSPWAKLIQPRPLKRATTLQAIFLLVGLSLYIAAQAMSVLTAVPSP